MSIVSYGYVHLQKDLLLLRVHVKQSRLSLWLDCSFPLWAALRGTQGTPCVCVDTSTNEPMDGEPSRRKWQM